SHTSPAHARRQCRSRPETGTGSCRATNFDRRHDWLLRDLGKRLVLEVELQSVAEVGQGLVNRPALTGYLNLDTARDVPTLFVGGDGRGQGDGLAHAVSVRQCASPDPPVGPSPLVISQILHRDKGTAPQA